jgi:tRNA nucleotidyltransferase (CCA-adding enzyme)
MHTRELTLPAALQPIFGTLASDGHRSVLVGPCVRALLGGRVVRDFQVATSAPAERVLGLFPHAVPIAPGYATIMVPTSAGPVDVTRYREGERLDDDLARRDFTINAIAYDPISDGGPKLIDPQGGLLDLEAGRLRTVGPARASLEEDPLRALRAARLVAELSLTTSLEIEDAMAGARPALRSLAARCLRPEISRLLLAPRPAAALQLLRRTGIEATVAPEVLADAGRLVDQLPPELPLRLAGWLRGTRAARILGRLRFSAPLVRDVETLLALHPLDGHAPRGEDLQLRRLIKRAGDVNLARLFVLREAELDAGIVSNDEAREVRARLSELRTHMDRIRSAGEETLRRTGLAIGGRDVMEILGNGPGPRVGRALRHLTERVQRDPDCNTEEALRELLRAWRDIGR